MKPHLRFDLDALALVPKVARAAEVEPGAIAYGLLQLWEWAWRSKRTTAHVTHLRGFFGAESLPAIVSALRAFGFLEPAETGQDEWTVCGADRYLRVSEGHSKGGHAAKSNLIPGAVHKKASRRKVAKVDGLPIGSPSADVGPTIGPTAISDQRAVNSDQRTATDLATTASQSPLPLEPPAEVSATRRLTDSLVAIFAEVRGAKYGFTSRDGKAAQALLSLPDVDQAEIERRWRAGLTALGWAQVSTLTQLVAKWNDQTAPPVGSKPVDWRKSPVRAEDVDPSLMKRVGDVTHEF